MRSSLVTLPASTSCACAYCPCAACCWHCAFFTIACWCAGNKNGLLLPNTTTDQGTLVLYVLDACPRALAVYVLTERGLRLQR